MSSDLYLYIYVHPNGPVTDLEIDLARGYLAKLYQASQEANEIFTNLKDNSDFDSETLLNLNSPLDPLLIEVIENLRGIGICTEVEEANQLIEDLTSRPENILEVFEDPPADMTFRIWNDNYIYVAGDRGFSEPDTAGYQALRTIDFLILDSFLGLE